MGGSFFLFFLKAIYKHVGLSFTTFLLCGIIIMGRALSFCIQQWREARRFVVYIRPDLWYDIIGGILLLKNLKDFNLLNYMKINLKGDYYLWDIVFHFL